MKTAKPVLENPTILRAFAPVHVLFNILLSAYLYSNFNNILTLLPAVFEKLAQTTLLLETLLLSDKPTWLPHQPTHMLEVLCDHA